MIKIYKYSEGNEELLSEVTEFLTVDKKLTLEDSYDGKRYSTRDITVKNKSEIYSLEKELKAKFSGLRVELLEPQEDEDQVFDTASINAFID